MKLNEIRDNEGALKQRIRVGRGIGSGKGKTGGRGVKGQTSRAGVAIKGFEGGQMPLYRRLPKRGFNNLFAKDLNEVNLGRIQQAVEAGKLDAKGTVTIEALVAAGVITRQAKDGVKILGVKILGMVCHPTFFASRSTTSPMRKRCGLASGSTGES